MTRVYVSRFGFGASWLLALCAVLLADRVSIDCERRPGPGVMEVACRLDVAYGAGAAEARVLVDFGDGRDDTLSIRREPLAFGGPVPRGLARPVAADAVSDFLLINTEIWLDSFVTALEFYTVGAGEIDFMMLKFNECGETPVQATCAEYISSRQHAFPSYVYYDFSTIRATSGYNFVRVSPPVFFRRGTVLYANTKKEARLAVDHSGLASFSDLAWTSTPLNQSANWRLYVRVLTNNTRRLEGGGPLNASRTLTKRYDAPGLYKISARLLGTELADSTVVVVGTGEGGPACRVDEIRLEGCSDNPRSPLAIKRSRPVLVTASSRFICLPGATVPDLDQRHAWRLGRFESDCSCFRSYTIADSVSSSRPSWSVGPARLAYGLYQLTYEFQANNGSVRADSSGYFEVVPSGLRIYALEKGVAVVTLGSQQPFDLQPQLFSSDLDGLADLAKLSFKFSCRVVPANSSSSAGPVEAVSSRCFVGPADFRLVSGANRLSINAGGLRYRRDQRYEFNTSAEHLGHTYFQVISVLVQPDFMLPIVYLGCRYEQDCLPFPTHFVVNADRPLHVYGLCKTGCDTASDLAFEFEVYALEPASRTFERLAADQSELLLLGSKTRELVLSEALFRTRPEVAEWQVSLKVRAGFLESFYSVGSSSIYLRPNRVPFNGFCTIEPDRGSALKTRFRLQCSGWQDSDGSVESYKFYASYRGSLSPIELGISSSGLLEVHLPAGPSSDSSRIYITVRVIDDLGGAALFALERPVQVLADRELVEAAVDEMTRAGPRFFERFENLSLAERAQELATRICLLNSLGAGSVGGVQVKEAIMAYVDGLEARDVSSIQSVASIILMLTENIREISHKSARTAILKTQKLAENLVSCARDLSTEQIKPSRNVLIGSAVNIVSALSASLDANSTEEAFVERTKLLVAFAKAREIDVLDKMLGLMSGRLAVVGQEDSLATSLVQLAYKRVDPGDRAAQEIPMNDALVRIPGLERLLRGFAVEADQVVQQLSLASIAPVGLNGDNETGVLVSKSLSLSFFAAGLGAKLAVRGREDSPVDFWIPRHNYETDSPGASFAFVNTSSFANGSTFTHRFELSGRNVSLHVEIRPESSESGFQVRLDFGTSSSVSQLFCPDRGLLELFLDMRRVGAFRGVVQLGVRQLNASELAKHCNQSTINSPTSPDYWLRVFTSGCYYYDETRSVWSSDGVEILPDSNATHAHCRTSHLTEFAGGLSFLPTSIDFGYALSHASFSANRLIYSVLIGVSVLYVLAALLCHRMDRLDRRKMGFYLLNGGGAEQESYFYEVIVHTGTQEEAETDSRVRLILYGDAGESAVRTLNDQPAAQKHALKRGCVDSFLMAVERPLGQLSLLKIWHDNSGRGDRASWYLRHVTVHDLQTREQFHFPCARWLALEKEDGLIDRLLTVDSELEHSATHTLSERARQQMLDGHLWFSIFTRPVQSTFTRLDRLTCCCVLLFLSMLMNILYYDTSRPTRFSASFEHLRLASLVKLGPITVTARQIVVSVITNLVVFVPSFVLVQIFRRSRRRTTRHFRIKKLLGRYQSSRKSKFEYIELLDRSEDVEVAARPSKKPGGRLTFPWWFKAVGYALSLLICAACIFFILMRGIQFGEKLVYEWLTSLALTLLASILLAQPIQVLLVAVFLIFVLRTSRFDDHYEDDHDDDGAALNTASVSVASVSYFSPCSSRFNYKRQLNETCEEISYEEAKSRRLRELRTRKLLRQLVVYSLYLWMLVMVTQVNSDGRCYAYQRHLRALLTSSGRHGSVEQIKTPGDVWDWAKSRLVPVLRPTPGGRFLSDNASMLLGDALLRQIRVRNGSCQLNSVFEGRIDFCAGDYSFFSSDKSEFGTATNLSRVRSAFKYRKSKLYLAGLYANYLAAGSFVHRLAGSNQTALREDLTLLQESGWLDRQTRALSVEFSLFNPNMNLFAYCSVLFEFLPTGVVLKRLRFDPLNVVDLDEALAPVVSLRLVCNVAYALCVVYLAVNELRRVCRLRAAYFRLLSSLVEWLIIAASVASLVIYLHRLRTVQSLLESIRARRTEASGVHLQATSQWNEAYNLLLGLCAFLGTVKLLRLLRYHRRIRIFMVAIDQSLYELMGFSLIFCVTWFAFVQLFYLLFGTSTAGFSTLVKSMETGFTMLLGSSSTPHSNRQLGLVLFVLFNVVLVFSLLNVFFSIMNHTYARVRSELVNSSEDEPAPVEYVTSKLRRLLSRRGRVAVLMSNNNSQNTCAPTVDYLSYRDGVSSFPAKIDQLVEQLLHMYNKNLELVLAKDRRSTS